MSAERLDLTAQGQVRYHLKTPYRDGTTHIVLEPLDSDNIDIDADGNIVGLA